MEHATVVRLEAELWVLVELNHVQRMNDGEGLLGGPGELDREAAEEEIEVADICLIEPLDRAVKMGCLDCFEVAPRG
jgi:hypothetical protein